MMAEGPAIAADHAVTSGQIPKTAYEDPLRVTLERTGMTVYRPDTSLTGVRRHT